MIVVEDFHKIYGSTVAVAGLSFQVEPGQVLGLVGHNGAGKTSTLKALAGIIPPTRGSLAVAGHDVVSQPIAAKARLAYIPDDPQLFDNLTVDEHLQFTAAAYRLENHEDCADELVEQFELTEKRHTPAEALSRGMRQKLAICCAYLHRPAVILFDEPLTGLDPWAIRKLKESIVHRAGQGSGVVVSSHLLAMVDDICTDFLILERGQATFDGPREELLSSYAHDEATLEEIFFRVSEAAPLAAVEG
ncbi:MAG: ABC transporter ATP-binding protein [Planctomycetota bacterium]|nr:ABC transporter ATP-binding protein [Planctomycetota bacterium]